MIRLMNIFRTLHRTVIKKFFMFGIGKVMLFHLMTVAILMS